MCHAIRCRPEQLISAIDCDPAPRIEQLERMLKMLEARCRELEGRHGGGSCNECREVSKRCDQIWAYCTENVCPGNVPFSRKTIDEHSQESQIILNEIVQDVGPGFVNDYPMGPGQSMKVTHPMRPGFIPTKINIDLHLNNNATNYLNIEIEFYLVGGSKPRLIGSSFQGNNFLNKDGTQILQEWPKYKGRSIEVGFHERVEVIMRHTGLQNPLTAATIRLHHDLTEWYRLCQSVGTGDCIVS